MKPYQNLSGDSGILAYEYGLDWIRIRFDHGGTYEYTKASIGAAHLRTLKRLADSGDELNTFINSHPEVKNGYAERLKEKLTPSPKPAAGTARRKTGRRSLGGRSQAASRE